MTGLAALVLMLGLLALSTPGMVERHRRHPWLALLSASWCTAGLALAVITLAHAG